MVGSGEEGREAFRDEFNPSNAIYFQGNGASPAPWLDTTGLCPAKRNRALVVDRRKFIQVRLETEKVSYYNIVMMVLSPSAREVDIRGDSLVRRTIH
jgi:hypothetical protein